MRLSAPIHVLKRQARRMSREHGIALHSALDRIAIAEGYSSWSLLSDRAPEPVEVFHDSLQPGELVLVAGRPGFGKTMTGLRLALLSMKAGRDAAFFTLEYSEREVSDRFRKLGSDPAAFAHLFTLDMSDGISAAHVEDRLAGKPAPTLCVIDYLQLLDQRRQNPPLDEQMTQLKHFAGASGHIFVLLSQIDRSYDGDRKACPDLSDVRLPNPVDLRVFDRTCFIGKDRMRFGNAVAASIG